MEICVPKRSNSKPTPLQAFRHRLRAQGVKRVEINVEAGDVELIRQLARRLVAHDDSADKLRAGIRGLMTATAPKQKIDFATWVREQS